MSTIIERIQYGFDRDSRRTWRRRTLATGEDYHYCYDGLSQVVGSDRGNLNLNCSAIAATPRHAESWDYDPTGNWHGYRVEEDGSVTLEQDRHHDKGNRLTQIEGEVGPFLLDRVGRVTQAAPDASGDWEEPLKFKWDAWSRLKEIRRASDDSVLAQYSYDGLSRRITREVSGVVHRVYYSENWKPLEERRDSATTASVQYLWGARHRDDLVRRDRDSDGGGTLDETRYVLMDYYSPASITDEEGAVTERYDFTAFGVRRILEPDFSPRATSECSFEFGYQGQFLDVESGLLNYGYRYYSPLLGRWLCKDPIEEFGGFNLMVFTANNSVNNNDRLGLLCDDCDGEAKGTKKLLKVGDTTPCDSAGNSLADKQEALKWMVGIAGGMTAPAYVPLHTGGKGALDLGETAATGAMSTLVGQADKALGKNFASPNIAEHVDALKNIGNAMSKTLTEGFNLSFHLCTEYECGECECCFVFWKNWTKSGKKTHISKKSNSATGWTPQAFFDNVIDAAQEMCK